MIFFDHSHLPLAPFLAVPALVHGHAVTCILSKIFMFKKYRIDNLYSTKLTYANVGVHRFCYILGSRTPSIVAASCGLDVDAWSVWWLTSQTIETNDGNWCVAACLD